MGGRGGGSSWGLPVMSSLSLLVSALLLLQSQVKGLVTKQGNNRSLPFRMFPKGLGVPAGGALGFWSWSDRAQHSTAQQSQPVILSARL